MDHDPASVPAAPAAGANDGERRQAERRYADRGKLERVSARGLIALLLSVVALALAAVVTWRQHAAIGRLESVHLEQTRAATASDKLQQQVVGLEDRLSSLDRRTEELGGLSARFEGLSDSVEELRARADAAQLPWIIAEARYLLEIANRRLTLERDADSALAAMEAADQRMSAARDPGLTAARRRLASEIQSIRTLRQPDLSGVAARLAAAEELAGDLVVLGAIPQRYDPPSTIEGSTPGFGRAWQIIRSSLTEIISVRRIGEDAVELVSLEEQGLRRQHLQLLLFACRVAALRGDDTAYRASLSTARHWLNRMFDPRDKRVVVLKRELAELEELDIAPRLPDISGSLELLTQAAKRTALPERHQARPKAAQ